MTDEILGDSVKDAFITRIVELFPFPQYTVYGEAISPQNIRFPHFFVFQLTVQSTEERQNYWWIDYLINIRYRHVENPSVQTTLLEKELDNVSFKLMAGLDTINWFGRPHKVTMARPNEKIDGVLQCFYNFKAQGTRPKEEVAKQLSLKLNNNVTDNF